MASAAFVESSPSPFEIAFPCRSAVSRIGTASASRCERSLHMRPVEIFTLISGLLISAYGCNKEVDRPAAEPSPPAVAGRDPVTNHPSAPASARGSIAEARCAREQHCDNVGDNKKFSSEQDCLSRIRADWKDDLNARECPSGVNQHELNECLTAVRGEDCSNPFDTLSRVAACTKGKLCEG